MDQISSGFIYIKNMIPRITDAKIKVGIFVGPQIRVLIQDVKCEVEKIKKYQFLGNHKRENYRDMVAYVVVQSYKAMERNVSLRVQFLDSHLQFFPENLGAVSDFTTTFPPPRKGYQGKRSPIMLAHYCLTLRREASQEKM